MSAQLSLAHRQLGDMAEEVRKLRDDTETSKAIHQKKAQVQVKRAEAHANAAIEKMQAENAAVLSAQSKIIQDIQDHWNEARHQLAYEREIVSTQCAKIGVLEQTIEASTEKLAKERAEYEKKCCDLSHIHNEQRNSLVDIQRQFEQCRHLVLCEQEKNVSTTNMLNLLKEESVKSSSELHKEHLAKQYLQTTLEEMSVQLGEETVQREFAQKSWDEEVELHQETAKKMESYRAIGKVIPVF